MKRVAAMLLVVLAAVCTTRKPPEPTGNFVAWKQPDNVANLLKNLELSIENLDLDHYSECFYDTFSFEATVIDSATYPTQLSGWDFSRETGFFDRLKTYWETHPDTLQWPRVTIVRREGTGDGYNSTDEDSLHKYSFEVVLDTVSSLGLPDTVRSFADFYIRKSENYYYLYRWKEESREVQGDTLHTWGIVKGTICQRYPCAQ